MAKVKLLTPSTINKIAAGEVVERPASCVKELVENAIDAGAKRIEIEIIEGGKSFIRVTDNGEGMTRDDALLAIQSHATSKLSSVDDLKNISTLGFRGEALPTIAAVSKLTLQTRTADAEFGTRIKVEGGKIVDTCDFGCKIGTTVIVENLFYNTPARLNFMKSTATEAGQVHDFVVKLALSRPDISFKFINGNRSSVATPGSGNLIDVLTALYGVEISESLFNVELSLKDFKIGGYVGQPNAAKTYRNRQTFIINGRVITGNRTIYKAIDEAYKTLVAKNTYPLAVLKIDVPQNTIDVNVHPRKTEIKFQDDGDIYSAVYRAVRSAVSDNHVDDLQKVAASVDKPVYTPMNLDEYFDKMRNDKADKEIVHEIDDENFVEVETVTDDNFDVEEKIPPEEPLTQPTLETFTPKTYNHFGNLRAIGQVALCYIVAQSDDELYIIDQHAAHERILFDRLGAYVDNVPAQILLIHQNLKFDSRETAAIENNLELFDKLGFSMELSGENEFRLTSIPADVAESDPLVMLREIISSLPDNDFTAQVDDKRRAEIAANIRSSFIAVASCRGAIKAGKRLSIDEMNSLLKNLSNTPHPHTCPHGRPTIIKFSSADLAKMFKRG